MYSLTYWKGHFDQVKIRVNYSHIVNEKQDFSNAYFIRRVYFGGWYDGMIVIENGFKGLFNALQKLACILFPTVPIIQNCEEATEMIKH